MKSEEIKESLEKINEVLHEVEGLKHDEKREKWLSYVALSTAMIAVLTAVVGLHSNQANTKSMLAKDDAVLFQSQASNAWAYYQAKSIKGHVYKVNASLFPEHKKEFIVEVDRYSREQTDIKAEAESLQKKAEEKNKKSEYYYEKHHIFDYGETFLNIAIALAAMSALLKNRKIWYFSILSSVIGLAYFGIGLMK